MADCQRGRIGDLIHCIQMVWMGTDPFFPAIWMGMCSKLYNCTFNRPWSHNRVVFLGDSIHATTPNLAQGGCQAIEDALCLALCMKSYRPDLERAYNTYYKLRREKVKSIVKTSWQFGKAAHSRNLFFHYLYRVLLEYAPATILKKQEQKLNDLSYLDELHEND